MNNIVKRLRSDSGQTQQEAAIDIATHNLDRTINKNLANQATPLLEELLRTGTSQKQGTAASALARIARDHADTVCGIEEDLVPLLYDDTIYQNHYFNATQAILALAALDAKPYLDELNRAISWYKQENAQRAWAVGILAVHYLAPDKTDAVDYRDIDFVCGEDVTLLVRHRLDNSTDDCIVAAILLDDILTEKKQQELRDMLLVAAQKHPETLENAVPYLEQNIRDRQHQSAEYALRILRRYAEVNPEQLTHLIDDVGVYLDPAQGYEEPSNATGFLAEVASVAPSGVAAYKERIEELEDHYGKHVQQYCSSILETLDRTEYRSNSRKKVIDSDLSLTERQKDANPASVDDKRTAPVETLEKLRELAEEDSTETVPKEATITRQSTQEYTRSDKVKQYVKARADGYCEGCGNPAPFTSKTGEPYLHAHHVHELSDGGSDTPETVIALCPNCHYRVHHAINGEKYNEKLKQKLNQIEGDDDTD